MGKGALSKYENRADRKSRRKAEKHERKRLLSKIEQNWDAKDLSSLKGLSFYEKVRFVLQSSWILNAWYEKLGLLIVTFLAVWKILNFFGLF